VHFEHCFQRDFEQFRLSGEPYAFTRYGDGERAICCGTRIQTSDGWTYPGGERPLAAALRASLQSDLPGYHIGISCPCCDERAHQWYLRHARLPPERITFANIFVNANHPRFMAWIEQERALERCVLIGSAPACRIRVPENAVSPPADPEPILKAMLQIDRPMLVAAGPLSCILIHEYWRRAERRQIVVDVGSALDPALHGRLTRRYHRPGSPTSGRVCMWS
jgi:hypothetical protein